MSLDDIKKQMNILFASFDNANENQKRAYCLALVDENPEIVKAGVITLIKTFQPSKVKPFPVINDILTASVKKDELQKAWEEFNKHYKKDYEPIPDMVYTIMRLIGQSRVRNAKESEWVWIEKEFKELYPKWKAGHLEVMSDPKAEHLKQLSSGTYYLPKGKNLIDGNVSTKPEKFDATPYFTRMRDMLNRAGGKNVS